MIIKAQKKPIVIDAVELNYDNLEFLYDWLGDSYLSHSPCAECPESLSMQIKTLEGEHRASYGDFIIKGVEGEFYPCKPRIFEKTYTIEEGGLTKEQIERREEFEKVIEPAMEWMAKNLNPHTKIIVEANSAELVEGIIGHKNDEFLVD